MNKKELRVKNSEMMGMVVNLANSAGHCFGEKELFRLFLEHVVAAGGYINATDYDLSMDQITRRLHRSLDELNFASYSLRMLLQAGAVDVQPADEFLIRSNELSALLVSYIDE